MIWRNLLLPEWACDILSRPQSTSTDWRPSRNDLAFDFKHSFLKFGVTAEGADRQIVAPSFPLELKSMLYEFEGTCIMIYRWRFRLYGKNGSRGFRLCPDAWIMRSMRLEKENAKFADRCELSPSTMRSTHFFLTGRTCEKLGKPYLVAYKSYASNQDSSGRKGSLR